MIIERHEYQTQILGWQAMAQMLRAEDEATLATGEENGVVVRWLYEPQANQTDALIALWKEWVVDPGAHTSRILQADFGIKSHVILEVEYADIVDFHTKWTAWGAQEGIEAFWGQWAQVARPGGTTELWELMP